MHNQVASTVSLAKTVLGAIDRSKELTMIPTMTLNLILTTFIENAQDTPGARALQSQQQSVVASRISALEGR